MSSTVEFAGAVAAPYEPGAGLPVFVEPTDARLRDDPARVAAWFAEHRVAIEALTSDVGAVVLRGFGVSETHHFGALVEHYPSPEFGYTAGATPRRAIEGKVFEATNAPPQFKIQLHQEMAYLPKYPARLAFFCKTPPASGGETIIGDMRRFEAGLPRDLRDTVAATGVLYLRNFRSPDWTTGHPVLDARHRPWTDAFGTTDRGEAEAQCAAMGLDFEWVGDSLTTSYRGQGVVRHPATGAEVWFNQLIPQIHSVQSVGADLFEAYAEHYEHGRPRPYDTCLGDGTQLTPDDVDAAYEVLDAVTVAFPWQAGDVMFVDNVICAHGRNTFTGARDIQVALLGEAEQ